MYIIRNCNCRKTEFGQILYKFSQNGPKLQIKFHYLPISAEARWERVEKRNNEKGETFSLHVNREMFDFCEGIFEEPTEEELDGAVII